VFQNASLFARLWPKLLRAHAVETYRRAPAPGDGADRDGRLRAVLGSLGRARGRARRNVGEGTIFEFRLGDLRGSALTRADQVVHVAVV
jgi:hypothetical protein